jgi:hypothetical protein
LFQREWSFLKPINLPWILVLMRLLPCPRLLPPIHLLDFPSLTHAILNVFGLELGKMDLPLIDLILSVEDVWLLVLFHVFSLLPNIPFQLLLLGVGLLCLLLTLALPVVLSPLPFVSTVLISQI